MHKYQKSLLYQNLPFTSIKANTPWLSVINLHSVQTKYKEELIQNERKNIPVFLSPSLSVAITNSNERHPVISKTTLKADLLANLTGDVCVHPFLFFFLIAHTTDSMTHFHMTLLYNELNRSFLCLAFLNRQSGMRHINTSQLWACYQREDVTAG